MTQEKYNTLHEFIIGRSLSLFPSAVSVSLSLSLSLVFSQLGEIKERWRCYQWETSWNKEMGRFLTLTRTGLYLALDTVMNTTQNCGLTPLQTQLCLCPLVSRFSADDLMTSGLHLNTRIPFKNVFISLYLNERPLAFLCLASQYWSKVQKSQMKPSFVECYTLHPLITPLQLCEDSPVWN